MADTLILYKKIEINLKASRDRINTPRLFNAKQRAVLLTMLDQFEIGNFQEVIELGQSDYTKSIFDYPVWEYHDEFVYDIIKNAALGIQYTTADYITKQNCSSFIVKDEWFTY